MNANFPLNEPQQRHIAVALASLEKLLADLRARLERGPENLRLVRYRDPLDANEAAALLPVVAEAEARLHKLADDLALDALTEPVRRTFTAGLDLGSVGLYDCRASGGLRGYGKVAPETADYLEREIPELDAVIQQLSRLLRDGEDRTETMNER